VDYDTRSAADRAESLVAEQRRRYPTALVALHGFAQAKGTAAISNLDWPGWCWLPMGASQLGIPPCRTCG
jgi:hypothetical protein